MAYRLVANPVDMARGTKTSEFGSNGWVGHDSSGYYARGLEPLWTIERTTEANDVGETAPPFDGDYCFFSESSESMEQLTDRSVHLMVTSPPYNVGKQFDEGLSVGEHIELIEGVLAETYRVLVAGGRACVNIANIGRKPYIPLHAYVIQAASHAGFTMRGEIVWQKGMNGASTAWGSWMSPSNPTLRDTHEYILVFQKGDFGRKPIRERRPTIRRDDFLEWTKSVWEFPPTSAKRARHPAPFPQELPRRLIQLYTYSDELVLDPFMGTGNAALAAVASGRKFVGYDIDPKYVKIAEQRMRCESIEQPVRLDSER